MGIVRKTQSIKMLLDEFQNETSAISVIELVKRMNLKLNKTTVYRALERLEDEGVLHSFLSNDGIKWYAKCSGCTKSNHSDIHPHFHCVECGKIDCLAVKIKLPNVVDREVLSTQILIQGKCELCV